jgi:transitional endoplasmic reticulum ATPase
MSTSELGTDFRHWEQIMRSGPPQSTPDKPTEAFYDHSTAKRVNTDVVITEAIRKEYPHQPITTVPAYSADLLQFAAAGHASANTFKDDTEKTLKWRHYFPPATRLDPTTGGLVDLTIFAKYVYTWKDHEFILYYVNGRDGTSSYPSIINQYLIGPSNEVDLLVLAAGKFTSTLHDEIWIFDKGYWQKDRNLWLSIQHSLWDNVILDEAMKTHLRDDAGRFFDSRAEYQKLGVPWKRGIIFHGPPGNGKTISIKATMHMLYDRKEPVPTLYVKTLASFFPPEFALGEIFAKARQEAPCYLVFEDLDSVVSDNVRSFFLNEVDGLSSNDGILMVGSTNLLDRLDPGISKRPSRFDRKYFFPNPNLGQRVQYCKFWQGKLKDNKEVKFPDEMCDAIADITKGFSLAYMQEAFVAALLVIAYSKDEEGRDEDEGDEDDWDVLESNEQKLAKLGSGDDVAESDKPGEPDDHLNDYVLWVEIKKQIELLRKELQARVVGGQ